MQRCGYLVEWRILNAADYGDATTRVRFFLQARKDGTPIRWPEPSHARGGADAMFGNRKRWRAAREVIDWTKPGRSVFDDPKYIRQPLSSKTLARTVRGLQRLGNPFWRQYAAALDIDVEGEATAAGSPETAFIIGKQSSPAIRDVDQPVMTVTTDSAPHLVEPSAEMVGANRNHNVPRDVQEPVPPATTAPGGGLYFVEAVAVPFVLGQQSGGVARDIAEPLPTIAASGAISLAEPLLIPYYRTGVAKSVDVPMEAITTKGRFGLATPMVVPYGPSAEARSVEQPVPTILSKDRLGIAEAILVTRDNQASVDDPMPTVTTKGAGYLAEAFIVPKFGERQGQEPRVHLIDDPLPTVTGDGAGRLVEPALVQVNHGGDDERTRSVHEPLTSLSTHRNVGLAEPMLLQMAPRHGDINGARSLDDPTYTIVANARLGLFEPALEEVRAGRLDPRRLVIVDGELRVLELRFRMLMNRELARAMSFDDEETQYEFVGNVGEVTKQIGNAVPVRTATALVRTILEDCLPVGALL
jgi:DNA (cytosine-5)-methyltransferase 1